MVTLYPKDFNIRTLCILDPKSRCGFISGIRIAVSQTENEPQPLPDLGPCGFDPPLRVLTERARKKYDTSAQIRRFKKLYRHEGKGAHQAVEWNRQWADHEFCEFPHAVVCTLERRGTHMTHSTRRELAEWMSSSEPAAAAWVRADDARQSAAVLPTVLSPAEVPIPPATALTTS